MKFNNDISAKQLRRLLDYNRATGIFRWLVSPRHSVSAGDVAGHLRRDGYVAIGIGGRRYMAHRLAVLESTGRWPPGRIRLARAA
jgi:hypothetical protein